MSDTPERDNRPTIGALLRRGAPDWSPLEQQAAWMRLKMRQTASRSRWVFAVAAIAACAAFAIALGARGWLGRRDHEAPPLARLTYEIEQGVVERAANGAGVGAGSAGDDSVVVRDADTGQARLRFSDGTSVALHRRARARVTSVEATGARLALLDGEIVVNVVHRPQSRWSFDAGPFSVLVEGTSFSLEWVPSEERMRLQMTAGVVTVKGPLGTDAMRVAAGQVLTVRLPGEISLERSPALPASAPAVSEPSLAPPSAEASQARGGDRAAASRPTARSPQNDGGASTNLARASAVSWRALIATGHSAEVVADAETRGLAAMLARGRREDLSALADAARYSRRNDVAHGALRALRERFKTTDSARDAAFFLGLVEEADDPSSPRALEWYRRYRTEAPHGLYVSDALGREILLERRIHGVGAARDAAREYLARFPHGALAVEAARIAAP
jgi:hypothetical protein